MRRIEIIVSPIGETRIETHGIEGEACRAATSQLERALGIKQAESLKPEFYAIQSNTIQQMENE